MIPDRRNFPEIPFLDKCSISVCIYSNMTCRVCPYSNNYRFNWHNTNLVYSSAHFIQHYSFNK